VPRVADILVETLVAAGVRNVYGVAGDSLNAITDALRPRTDIGWVHVRHEEAAAFAAGAEAQLTGNLAVCAGSCGPGNLHLINGLYDAHRSRAPVLALAAQIPSSEIGSNYFQETHPERIFGECSHYSEVISKPDQLPWVLETAIETSLAHRGVSVVVLPGDVAMEPAAARVSRPLGPRPLPRAAPSEGELAQLVSLLNQASKVTILAGSGCAGARAELLSFAAKIRAPIVHTLRAKESLEYDNPFDVGMTGLIGFSSGYHAMMDADLLLMLGTDFPYRQFYPADATKVQVDLDAAQIGRRTRVDLGLVGDVAATLQAVTPRVTPKGDGSHLTNSLARYAKSREGLDELANFTPGKPPIHPQYVVKVLDELARNDAIVTCDVGLPTVWAARYLRMNGRRRLIGSFWHGSMANALPQAIGAQTVQPDRQVISLSGDGGIAMLFGEILSLHQLGLPVKVIVFDNSSLGFVQLEQKSAGFLESGVDLANPDFAAVARAAGLLGLRAEAPEDVRPMVAQLLSHPGPALLDAVVARQEVVMPPSIERSVVKGFGLWLIKAVLSGRGDEIVDLAKVNLFR
jgi:pyruvate dehydrogenase (quinone)